MSSTSRVYEYIILGAGPGGLQVGYYFERDDRDYLIIDREDAAGHFFVKYPRHRALLSINKLHTGYDDPEINLRWDWNSLLTDDHGHLFTDYSAEYIPDADDLVRYFEDFAEKQGLNIRYGTEIERISRDGVFRLLDTEGEEYLCRNLIVATGVARAHEPVIPGVELAESYCEVSVDPQDFVGQRVLIVGKGNSGFETADNLLGTASLIHLVSPNSVKMAWQTHYVGNLRAVNNSLLDSYQLKSQNAVLDATVDRIERDDDDRYRVTFSYAHANGERETIEYDRVILCTGFQFDDSRYDETCYPAIDERGRYPRQTSTWESVNVPDLYFAGVLTQERDYRKSTSAFIHGFRYNSRALARILAMRHHGEPWPSREVEVSSEKMMRAVIRRVNRTSALWQQFGFLADVLAIGEEGGRYYEEMPLDFAHESDLVGPTYFTITLEYGPDHAFGDPFAVERIARHDVDRAAESNFLHPVVRLWENRGKVAEHHIIEDLAAEWTEPEHTEPLQAFFESVLARIEAAPVGASS